VEFFGFPRGATSVLASWVRHLNVVRNICAHHGRLWNRVIRVRPMFPRKAQGPWVDPWPDDERVWTTLTILLYWSDRIRSGNSLRQGFGALLAQADAWMLRSMGVPANWREQALWKAGAQGRSVVGGGAG
jgi:abortive infection bacteriophage resistance protein